jgi:hypothetical protein
MSSTTKLFDITRGDDFVFSLTFKDAEGAEEGVSGSEFMCTMKKSLADADADAPVSVDMGPVSGVDADAGLVYVELPRAQTVNLVPGYYYFDVQQKKDTKILTIVNGRVKVLADVTQRV